jgi:hypothetical protein
VNRRRATSTMPVIDGTEHVSVLRRLGTTLHRDENGVALVMVIGVGAVLALLTVAAIAIALGSARSARIDQDWNGALSAAYAGVEEYQSRLAADPTYGRFGNPAAPYSASSASAISLPSGSAANPAFGLGAAGSWATVPGSGATASYRYEVDVADFDTTGGISLRSTGRVGAHTRTVVAELKVNSFLDYLYFTDFEVQDPTGASNEAACTQYAYAGRDDADNCGEISFDRDDVLKGPVHSNDKIRSCGARFDGPVTTAFSAPAGQLLYSVMDSNSRSGDCVASNFSPASGPTTVGAVVMPATNAGMKLETRSDLTNPAGCLFTGPTQITFNSDGTVTVRSPWTRKTQITGDPASGGSAPAACGVPGRTGLGSLTGSTFTVPANNVIYVQDVPGVSTDPNYWSPTDSPRVQTATGSEQLPVVCTDSRGQYVGNGIGYPIANESARAADYGCRVGDAFVQGVLRGSVTVATSHFLYVTGNVTLANANRDMLGLVGNDAVLVWNPVNGSGETVMPEAVRVNREIHAAILSVSHTFKVQNQTQGGARGTLKVVGAIAQKFRGVVRSGTNGYLKDYSYDSRFTTRTPPKFLLPVSTTYAVTLWIETTAAFDSRGAVR